MGYLEEGNGVEKCFDHMTVKGSFQALSLAKDTLQSDVTARKTDVSINGT